MRDHGCSFVQTNVCTSERTPQAPSLMLQVVGRGYAELLRKPIRACANRSWLSGGAAFPTVATPGFPDESTHYDDHIGERNPEADDSILPLGTPRQFLV